VAQHKDTVSSLTENIEETNEARGIFLSEIIVHKLRVANVRALQHEKEKK
jgi:hypothetical protein